MGSRVNTKFIIILTAALLLVFSAVATVGYMKLYKGASELARLGDEAAAAGDWEKAVDLYGRAVHKDQTNAAWLRLWINAMEHVTPKSRQLYTDQYFGSYMNAKRALTDADPTNPEAHRSFFDEHYVRLSRLGADLGAWESFASLAEDFLRIHGGDETRSALIRRYRGLARVGVYSTSADLPQDVLDQTVTDLQDALKLDPTDARAAGALAELHRQRAGRLRLQREDQRADAAINAARVVVNDFLARNPQNPAALLELARLEFSEAVRTAPRGSTGAAVMAGQRELLDRLYAAVRAADPAKLDPQVPIAASSLAVNDPGAGREAAISLLDHALGAKADNAMLLLQKAEIKQHSGDVDAALAIMQHVIDLPDRPLSFEGLILLELRNRAATRQVDAVLRTWSASLPAAEKDAVIRRATEYRDALAARIGSDRIQLDLIDAKIRFAAGELGAARQLLSRYNEASGNKDPQALLLLGEILMRQGSHGGAKELFARAIELRPRDVSARMALASVESTLQEYDKAADQLRIVLQIEPDNARAAEQLRVMADLEKGDQAVDPVIRALQEAQRMISGVTPDPQAAIARLRQGVAEAGPDIRFLRSIAQIQAAMGDRDGALETTRQGLASHPQDDILRQLERGLTSADPLKDALEAVDASGDSPFRKHLIRSNIYAQAGNVERARAELQSARTISPNAPELVEFDFTEALANKDLPRARALADTAAQRNTDNVSGLSFRARLAFAEDRFDDAGSFLQQAVEADPFNAVMWRYLGEVRLVQRQFDRAAEAFGKAVQIRPSDLASVKGLARSRFLLGRPAEALAAARAADDSAFRDPDFVELLVTLESVAPGGDRAKAVAIRRQLMSRNPADKRNRAALAELLINTRAMAEARTIIDALRAEGDSTQLVEIEARWHIASGNPQAAARAFTGFIDAIPADKRTDEPYIAFARLMVSINEHGAAEEALEEARAHQDPKVMSADRELADLYYRTGLLERALSVLDRILAADVNDEDLRITRARIDCLNRLGRFQDADAALARIASAVAKDHGLMILQAQAAAGRGDRSRARDLFDRAIAAANRDPRGYAARAEFLAADPALLADAEQDLIQVIRLEPRFPGARQRLATLAANGGNWEKALGHLRDAVKDEPENDALRGQFIGALIARQRYPEANELLEETIRLRPDSLSWRLASVEIYQKSGAPDRAIPHMERAWEMNKSPAVAAAYVHALLNARTPNTRVAAEVLATPELKTDSELALLLARARLRLVANQRPAAERDITSAFQLLDQSSAEQAGAFFAALTTVIPDAVERLRIADALRAAHPFRSWTLLSYAALRLREPGGSDGLADLVLPLTQQTDDSILAITATSLLGSIYREQKRYTDAENAFRKLVEINPEDPNFNNNYAYVVGHDLKRPGEALPYAEKAAKLLPQHASALHTLGAIYVGLNRLTEAEAVLSRALSAAMTPAERAPVYMTLARLKLAQDSRADSARYVSLLEDAIRGNAALTASYGADLRDLKARLDAR